MKKADKVLYNNVEGVIEDMINDSIAMVRLEDGLVYTLELSQLTPIVESSVHYEATDLKNIDKLKSLATILMESGVSSLKIKNGVVEEVTINETLEEKKAKYVKQAIAEAEAKAEKEFEKEQKKDAKK